MTDQPPTNAARSAPPGVSEVTGIHTRLLRVALAVEESRAYWTHVEPHRSSHDRTEQAFSERWFGSRTMRRVDYLMRALDSRFLCYPAALEALRIWGPDDPVHRRLVCHWHVQLSDPLYRGFASEFLPMRRAHPVPTVDMDGVVRWINQRLGSRWNPSTTRRMASGLLQTATEAGLCGSALATRPLLQPQVPDVALSYLLHLLRAVPVAGSLLDNPYLVSVGLDPQAVQMRLRRGLPGLGYRQVADVREFDWAFSTLSTWAEGMVR